MTIPAPPAKVHHRKCWKTLPKSIRPPIVGAPSIVDAQDVETCRMSDVFQVCSWYVYHQHVSSCIFSNDIYIHLIYISSILLHVLTLHPKPTSRGNPSFLAWDRYRPHQALVIHGASALFVEIKFGHFCKVQVRYQNTYTVTRLFQPISVCFRISYSLDKTLYIYIESTVCKAGPMLRHICPSGAWTNKRRMTKPQCRDNRHTVSAYAGSGEPSLKDEKRNNVHLNETSEIWINITCSYM